MLHSDSAKAGKANDLNGGLVCQEDKSDFKCRQGAPSGHCPCPITEVELSAGDRLQALLAPLQQDAATHPTLLTEYLPTEHLNFKPQQRIESENASFLVCVTVPGLCASKMP